eukprot:jgi/Bigna1/72319/fgenesh1_pg.19_\
MPESTKPSDLDNTTAGNPKSAVNGHTSAKATKSAAKDGKVEAEKVKRRRRRKKKKVQVEPTKNEKEQESGDTKTKKIVLSPEEVQAVQKENEYLVLTHKRLRAVRKRMDRIERVEKAVADGLPINCDQQAALASKSTVQTVLLELEKLHGMLTNHALAEKLEKKIESAKAEETKKAEEAKPAEETSNAETSTEDDAKTTKSSLSVAHKEIQANTMNNAFDQHLSTVLDVLAAHRCLKSYKVHSGNKAEVPIILEGKVTVEELSAMIEVAESVGNPGSQTALEQVKALVEKSADRTPEGIAYGRLAEIVTLLKGIPEKTPDETEVAERQDSTDDQVAMRYEARDFMVPSQIHPSGEDDIENLAPSSKSMNFPQARRKPHAAIDSKLEFSKTAVHEIPVRVNPNQIKTKEAVSRDVTSGRGKKHSGGRGRRGRGRGGRGRRNAYHIQGAGRQYRYMNGVHAYPPYQMPHLGQANQPPHYMSPAVHPQMPPQYHAMNHVN